MMMRRRSSALVWCSLFHFSTSTFSWRSITKVGANASPFFILPRFPRSLDRQVGHQKKDQEKRKNKNKRNDSIHSIWAILFSSLLIVEHRLRSGCHAVGWVFSGASRSMKTCEFRLFVSALSSAELNKYCCLLRRRAAKVSAAVTHHRLATKSRLPPGPTDRRL